MTLTMMGMIMSFATMPLVMGVMMVFAMFVAVMNCVFWMKMTMTMFTMRMMIAVCHYGSTDQSKQYKCGK